MHDGEEKRIQCIVGKLKERDHFEDIAIADER
jgi:hypothetical protein